MAEMSKEERYEVERRRVKLYRNIIEPIIMALMITGIVTAALDVSFGGFTPIYWFVLSFGWVIILTCMEVLLIRTLLEGRK